MIRQNEFPRCRIERCKKLIFHKGIRTGQPIQQRGFSRIGVSDDRRERKALPDSSFALNIALFAHFRKFFLQLRDSQFDHSAVVFDLFFSFAAGTHRTAVLTGKVTPCAGQTRQKIFVSGQFHLQDRLPCTCPFRKNIQNDLLAVHNIQSGQSFQIPLLGCTQLGIEHDHFRMCFFRGFRDLFRFAAADIIFRVRSLPDRGHHLSCNGEFQCGCQFFQFFQMFFCIRGIFPSLGNADKIRSGFCCRFFGFVLRKGRIKTPVFRIVCQCSALHVFSA